MVSQLPLILLVTSIVGALGNMAKIQNFPYQALLKHNDVAFCGGSIISKQHILTAAHCVAGKSIHYPEMTIHVGSTYSKEASQKSNVYYIYRADIHPKYNGKLTKPYVYQDDIAVITLKEQIKFSKSKNKIELEEEEVRGGDTVTISGWGITTYSPMAYTNDLFSNTLPVITNNKCSAIIADSVQKEQFCTLSKEFTRCTGDSGGPVVKNGKLVGVASHAVICQKGVPDIYTSVYHSLWFIRSILN